MNTPHKIPCHSSGLCRRRPIGILGHQLSRQDSRLNGRRRNGQTMLELVAATIIISIALVPTLKFSRKSLESLERVEQSEQCHLLCVSKIEEVLALTSFAWSTSSLSGDFADVGWRQYRYLVTRSDATSDGGSTDALVTISVLVWFDANSSGNPEGGEASCRLVTKLAKLQTLQNGIGN